MPFKSTIVRAKSPEEPNFDRQSTTKTLAWVTLALILTPIELGASRSHPETPPSSRPMTAEMLEPLTVDDEMKAWVSSIVSRRAGPERRLEALVGALLDSRGLGEIDFPEPTPTAAEAFHSRSANCVGFALLFVALAREAEIPAFFVVIPQRRMGSRGYDLRIIEDHLAAGAVVGGRLTLYDVGGRIRHTPPAARPVSDLTALAVFQSNRGTEMLAGGRLAAAMARLELAIELDPKLTAAWVNFGVGRRRSGDFTGAENAYRRALELDPQHPGARDNLVNLLDLYGRFEEASTLRAEPASPDPLDALAQAATRLERGELKAARTLYLKALALSR